MGSRFKSLEFNDEEQSRPLQSARSEPEYDDRHYLQEAKEFFHWGHFEPALRSYTRALQQNRALVPAWVGQVQMLVQLAEYHEAKMWAEKALELFKNNAELLAARAQALCRIGDRRGAQASSDGAIAIAGSSPWRWQARGEVLLALGHKHYDECFQRALGEPSADWFDRVIIANIYLFHRRATNALQYLKQAIELQPAHGYTWFLQGHAQLALGLAGAARTSYEHCLEMRPDYREARDALRNVKESSGIRNLIRRVFR